MVELGGMVERRAGRGNPEQEEAVPARPRDGLRSGLRLAAVLAAAGVIFAVPAGRHPLWDPDEARQAVLARDILEHGRWLAPQIRDEPNMHKPPLYRWSIAVASLPAGRVTELTAAIPSLVSALAGVAGVVQIGRLLWGWPTGLLAGLILATTPTYFENSHRVLPDMMMTAWLVWALYWLLRARRAAWTTRPVLAFYGKLSAFESLRACAGPDTTLILLATSGLAHLPPIKVVTILAGAVQIGLGFFVVSCVLARGLRFFMLAFLLRRYGPAIRHFIERRLKVMAVLAAGAAILLYFGLKLVAGSGQLLSC